MKKTGVLGAGTMGAGIIQVMAQSGYEVTFIEQEQQLDGTSLNGHDTTNDISEFIVGQRRSNENHGHRRGYVASI